MSLIINDTLQNYVTFDFKLQSSHFIKILHIILTLLGKEDPYV